MTKSSSQIAIKINNLSKEYHLFKRPSDRLKHSLGFKVSSKKFLALQGINLTIKKGEFWGIVGKNGSGKSTLLKIIAGQLSPTEGSVILNEEATLLQLGLGFDPELTGLENIKQSRLLQVLDGDSQEVYDFIEKFSELGEFINYPVKTYSSGMYSRLAFSTAIAGNQNILLADEVLSVGDLNFSQKCLNKMRELKNQGKTIILVTHDVNSVKAFCDKAIWINEGKVGSIGEATEVAEQFRNFMIYGVDSNVAVIEEKKDPDDLEEITLDLMRSPNINRCSIASNSLVINSYKLICEGENTSMLVPGKWAILEFMFTALRDCRIESIGFTLHNQHGLIAIHLNSEFIGGEVCVVNAGKKIKASFRFIMPFLANGEYSISYSFNGHPDEGALIKYDYDSSVVVENSTAKIFERQGGYVLVDRGEFCCNEI